MKITRKKINNIPVTLIDIDKFKSICGAMFFKMPIEKEMVVTRNLIRNILIHSCKKYPSNRLLNINCLENYDTYYSSNFRRDGNYATNYFLFRTLDERYTDKNNLNRVMDTFYEIIFNPNSSFGKFDEDEFNLAIQKRRSNIESKKERAESYVIDKLYKQMGDNTPISYVPELEILNKVTNEGLYKEYLNMINNSEVSFVIAGKDVSKIKEFKFLNNVKTTKYDKNLQVNSKINNKVNDTIEEYNGLQSVLGVGLKLKDLTYFESTYVLPVYNNILGSGASSRLFDIIREKNSLCYSCFSRAEKDDNIIDIYSGIENQDYEKALDLIKEVIQSMKKITGDELKRAKIEIISSLKESLDELSNYVVPIYLNELYNEEDISKKIEEVKKVTKQDVENLSKKIYITDSFFFKGGKTDA